MSKRVRIYLDYGGPAKLMTAVKGFPLRTLQPGQPLDCDEAEADALCSRFDGTNPEFGRARIFRSSVGPEAPAPAATSIHPAAPAAGEHPEAVLKRAKGRAIKSTDMPRRGTP